MNRILPRLVFAAALAFAALVSIGVAAPVPAPLPAPAQPPAKVVPPVLPDVPIPDLAKRLTDLSPANPEGYFLLAEDLMSESASRPARDLARHLLVLSCALDRASRTPHNLGASSCLALAALTIHDDERRWLTAMAQLLDTSSTPDLVAKPRPRAVAPVLSEQTATDLATTLGLARAGEGRRAEQYLAKPGVRPALDAYQSLLEDEGEFNAVQGLQRTIAEWPLCPECQNRRVVTRTGRADPNDPNPGSRLRLCPTCNGNPGPKLTLPELAVQLRMESALLHGIHRLWSAQALADNGEPLRDPDPDELPNWYHIDTSKTIFRDGRWIAPPATTPVPPAPSPAPAPAH